jgi:hypothetical protein
VSLRLDAWEATYWSVQVFSTLGFPEKSPKLVTLQVALNFIFLAVLLARFLGMPEEKRKQTEETEQQKQP